MHRALALRTGETIRRCPSCFKNVSFHRRSIFGRIRAYDFDESEHVCEMPQKLLGKIKRICFGE